jgi:hypothetical protein
MAVHLYLVALALVQDGHHGCHHHHTPGGPAPCTTARRPNSPQRAHLTEGLATKEFGCRGDEILLDVRKFVGGRVGAVSRVFRCAAKH